VGFPTYFARLFRILLWTQGVTQLIYLISLSRGFREMLYFLHIGWDRLPLSSETSPRMGYTAPAWRERFIVSRMLFTAWNIAFRNGMLLRVIFPGPYSQSVSDRLDNPDLWIDGPSSDSTPLHFLPPNMSVKVRLCVWLTLLSVLMNSWTQLVFETCLTFNRIFLRAWVTHAPCWDLVVSSTYLNRVEKNRSLGHFPQFGIFFTRSLKLCSECTLSEYSEWAQFGHT
jgi:hypothetical protein